jgi:cell division protein FtsB
MKKVFKIAMILVVLVSFLAMPAIGLAEEYTTVEEVKKEEKKAVEIEDMVVTGTKIEKRIENLTDSVK